MTTVNVHEAKTNLSRLLVRVEAGETILIARDGEPIAKLERVRRKKRAPRLGAARGKVKFVSDFDAPLPKDVLETFEQ